MACIVHKVTIVRFGLIVLSVRVIVRNKWNFGLNFNYVRRQTGYMGQKL